MSISCSVTVALAPEVRGGPFVFHTSPAELDAMLGQVAQLGFPGVEIFPGKPEDIEPEHLGPLLQKHGLKLAAVGSGAGWVIHKLRLSDPDVQVREKAVAFVGNLVKRAGALGAPVIIGSMQGKADPDGKEATLDRLGESVARLGELSAQAGQRLLLEPLNRYESDLLNRLDDAAVLIRRLKTEHVAILADLFHMNIEETDLAEAIVRAGPLVGHVHLADSNRSAAGLGHTPMDPVFAALRKIEYRGFVSAEVFPRPDALTAAARTLEVWRAKAR